MIRVLNLPIDISLIIKEKIKIINKVTKLWERVRNKLFFVLNLKYLKETALFIQKLGYHAYYISQEFAELSEIKTSYKIKLLGDYYHLISMNILDKINEWNNLTYLFVEK